MTRLTGRQMKLRQYNAPPVVEAFVEFRFCPSQEWDDTMPGRLHRLLHEDYPGKPRTQKLFQAELQTRAGRPANLAVQESLAKVQLLTADGSRLVGVGKDVLSIHVLPPYSGGWKADFKPRIERALESYWEVAEPQGVIRVDMRYINKIVIPETRFELREYLKCAPTEVNGLPGEVTGFLGRVNYVWPDHKELVLIQSSLPLESDEESALLLDIALIAREAEPLERVKSLSLAEELHGRGREVFEAVITDKTRELFDAV